MIKARDCSATMVPRTNGEALLAWHRVRPPCGYLDRVAGAGMAKALGRYGGHCLRVREGGLIRVGDEVTVV